LHSLQQPGKRATFYKREKKATDRKPWAKGTHTYYTKTKKVGKLGEESGGKVLSNVRNAAQRGATKLNAGEEKKDNKRLKDRREKKMSA